MDVSVWSYVAFGALVLFIGWRVLAAKAKKNKPGGSRDSGAHK